jgi:HlyD family secretion protein
VETQTLRTDLVYRVRIIVDAPDEGLRQGMPVTVTAVPGDASAARDPKTPENTPNTANRPTAPDPASAPGAKSAP